MELAVVGAPGVLAQLGATGLLRDGADVRVFKQLLRDFAAQNQRFLERGAGQGGHVNNEMAFAKLGEELAAKEGQGGDGGKDQRERHTNDRAGPAAERAKPAAMPLFEPADVARLLMRLGAGE